MQKCILLVISVLLIPALSWAGGVKVEELVKSTQSWNGVSLPDFSEKETEVTVLRITIEPHTELPMHIHPVINVAYMLSGELNVISAKGEKKLLKKGDSLIELVNQKHYGINSSDEPVEILVVYIGEENGAITVKEK